MKMKVVILTLLALFFTTGCAKTAKISRPISIEEATEIFAEPTSTFTVGEKFTYVIAWKGITVGNASATVKESTIFQGYEVYKIEVVAKTTEFLSKLFKVEDTFISYMDKDKLISRGFEATIREGRFKKDLIVNYDSQNRIATYKNLRDGSVKTSTIEKDVQDPVSASYFFRTIPVTVGDKIKVVVNLNEKNYEIFGMIEKRSLVVIPAIGTFNAFLVRPYVKLKGKVQKRGKAWGYLSADEKRIPIYIVIKVLEVPWIGEVTATLTKMEYI